MKKFLLVVITILPTLLSAQNGIVISNFSVSGSTITLDLSWKKVGMPTLWLDSAWVFVDYNNAGVMKRLPLAAGATLTATSAPGVGKVITVPGNTDGVWVVGNARTEGSFSATVALPFVGSNISGACAYASNYPPLGRWNDEGTILTITGTPPYTLQLESSTGTITVPTGSPFLLPGGYTLQAFTDQTGAPGMTHCIPPTAPESLTASSATVCEGASVTLAATGGSDGSGAQFQWGTGTVGVGGILTSSNTYLVSPTNTTTYWIRRVSTDNCGTSTAITRTITVNEKPTLSTPYGGSNNQTVDAAAAITAIKYTTTGATTVTVDNLPIGITANWTSNTITINGTSSATGTKVYTVTASNNGCSNATSTGTITIEYFTPPYAASTQTWTVGTQIWSAYIKVPTCNVNTFTVSTTAAYCRNTNNYLGSGYLYNRKYVDLYTQVLCPSPWLVPSNEDYETLRANLGCCGNIYLGTSWGAAYSGVADGPTNISYQGTTEHLLTSSGTLGGTLYHFRIDNVSAAVTVAGNHGNGYSIRCVRYQ